MMIFKYIEYKKFVRSYVETLPKGGRGQYSKIAALLQVQTPVISQIFSGKRDLTCEQGLKVAQYFSLSEIETAYFIQLIRLSQSSSPELRTFITRELELLKRRGLGQVEQQASNEGLGFQDGVVFTSHWRYAAVHILSSLAEYQSVDAIASHLQLPKGLIQEVAQFLIQCGLCSERAGRLKIEGRRNLFQKGSVQEMRHLENWHLMAAARLSRAGQDDLFFSFPASISHEDFQNARNILRRAINEIRELISATQPQGVACLNVSWFRF